MKAPSHPIIDNLMRSMSGDAMRPEAARAPRNTQTAPSTPHQRQYIRTMMQQLDLDTMYVTTFHRRFFRAAELPPPQGSARMDPILCGLTQRQASRLIEALKREVPSDE